jgi:hypothetical protein
MITDTDTNADLLDRIAELEERAQRLVLAGDDRDGWGAWHNLLETRLMQERDFDREVLSGVLAEYRNQVLDACKTVIMEALAQRVRGTYDPKANYVSNDVVACNGASFIARRDGPGSCPGPGWQMIAAQGKRGVPGERGEDAQRITSWAVDRVAYTITPRFSDGSLGPTLDLRPLFEQFHSETT